MCATSLSPNIQQVNATTPTATAASWPARRLALGLAVALTSLLPLAPAGAATIAVPSGSGVTMPLGVAQSADTASVWVSDELLGVCRVTLATPDAPASVVRSEYCLPEVEPAPGAPEPVGPGPSGAGPMAYDPGSSSLFVAEGTSQGSGVWRLRLDAAGTAIESAVKLVDLGGNRVTALALSPAGHLDFTAKDDAVVRRLPAAATAAPGAPTTFAGAARTAGVLSLTHLGDALYLADGAEVTRIATPGAGDTNAVPVPGFGAGAPSALAADQSRGLVFAGTALPSTVDRVEVLTPGGAVETYATGFAGVTALGLTADGALLIADDPPAAAGHPESAEQGRIHIEARHATGVALVTFTAQPDPYSAQTTATFSYTSSPGAEFWCRFDGGAWGACPTTMTYPGLADGPHTFEVRAAPGPGGWQGPIARGSFVVDTLAPEAVQVDNPAADRAITRDRLRLYFSTNEQFVRFACALDGGPAFACDSPTDLRDLGVGEHEVVITATDLAQNTSAPSAWRFARTVPPAPPAAAAAGPAPAAPVFEASSVPATCRKVRKQARKGRYSLGSNGRSIVARLTAPPSARYAKLTLRKRRGSGPAVQALETRSVPVSGASGLGLTLTNRQAARLRSGRYRLAVSYGTCATLFGDWTELTLASTTKKKASR